MSGAVRTNRLAAWRTEKHVLFGFGGGVRRRDAQPTSRSACRIRTRFVTIWPTKTIARISTLRGDAPTALRGAPSGARNPTDPTVVVRSFLVRLHSPRLYRYLLLAAIFLLYFSWLSLTAFARTHARVAALGSAITFLALWSLVATVATDPGSVPADYVRKRLTRRQRARSSVASRAAAAERDQRRARARQERSEPRAPAPIRQTGSLLRRLPT